MGASPLKGAAKSGSRFFAIRALTAREATTWESRSLRAAALFCPPEGSRSRGGDRAGGQNGYSAPFTFPPKSGCAAAGQLLKKARNQEGKLRVTAATNKAPDRQAMDRLAILLAHFERAGFARREPRLLQPAGVFLDRSGEDFRGHLYLTTDASGAELCLRPEYTIPVCLDYLASAQAGEAASFAYGGSIFRAPLHGALGQGEVLNGEFLQAGIESFGRDDREAADAEILGAALDAAGAAGAAGLSVRIGDAGKVKSKLHKRKP